MQFTAIEKYHDTNMHITNAGYQGIYVCVFRKIMRQGEKISGIVRVSGLAFPTGCLPRRSLARLALSDSLAIRE